MTVNGQSTYLHGEYYWQQLAIGNPSAAQWQSITNKAVEGANSTSVTGNVFLARSPEVFLHDLDGNLCSDGRWTNRWDAERTWNQ